MIDSHAHINNKSIINVKKTVDDINQLNYLKYVINIGLDYETSEYAIALSNQENKFYAVIGIHPLYEGTIKSIYDLYRMNDSSRVVGIGETGLDKRGLIREQEIKFHE